MNKNVAPSVDDPSITHMRRLADAAGLLECSHVCHLAQEGVDWALALVSEALNRWSGGEIDGAGSSHALKVSILRNMTWQSPSGETPKAFSLEPVTEDMIEEECLICDEPTLILPSRRRARAAPQPRGTVRLAGDFAVCMDKAAGEIASHDGTLDDRVSRP